MTLPVVGEDQLASFYPDSYNAYGLPGNPVLRLLASALFRWRYWRSLRRPPLASLRRRPGGRLLDVGGGRGDLGLVLRWHGWRVTSLDPSERACAQARSRGVDGVCGTLTAPPDTLGHDYDAVVFQHSLEHVVDPATDLSIARERMADGALLAIMLPNFDCWQRRAFAANWFHLDVPRHRTHFTPKGLETLLSRTGFEAVTTSTSTSADGLPMSLQYTLVGHPLGAATGRYLSAAAGLVIAPAVAAASPLLGGGDMLNAESVKSAGVSGLSPRGEGEPA
jgi:SAM-dependent methyltransferase